MIVKFDFDTEGIVLCIYVLICNDWKSHSFAGSYSDITDGKTITAVAHCNSLGQTQGYNGILHGGVSAVNEAQSQVSNGAAYDGIRRAEFMYQI